MSEPKTLDQVSAALFDLRKRDQSPRKLADVDRTDAYKIQRQLAESLAEQVAGWKVAIDPEGVPIAAPLLGSTILASGERVMLPVRRPTRIETELAVKLADNLPPRDKLYDRDEIVAAIAEIGSAFELAAPYVGEPPESPFGLFLADYLGNYRNIVGPLVATRPPSDRSRAQLFLDSELMAEGAHPRSDPLAPLVAYVNRQVDCLGGLKAGQIIITGSYTKPLLVAERGSFKGCISGLRPVEVTLDIEK